MEQGILVVVLAPTLMMHGKGSENNDVLSATYAFLRLDWCTGGWLICVDLDFQTCQFPAAVMECESSIFHIFGAVEVRDC